MTNTIHWLGAGLSSVPGIKRLAKGNTALTVWNRSLEKAQNTLKDIKDNNQQAVDIKQLDWQILKQGVKAGDVVISMLPATKHLEVAQLCLANNAHFVSSSYISPEMAALDQQAKSQELCFVNEVGLDPGLDHLLAHLLVEQYQQSANFSPDNKLYFRSYCGGFPKVANDFKYKFSWSPLGVLKALKSPAKWLAQGQEKTSQAPWEALSDYTINFNHGKETFQAYPNRDSLPFLTQYHFADDWQVEEFVRGTLRLSGWSDAWQYLFDEIAELTSGETGTEEVEQRLTTISQELEKKYAYDLNEPDRVVLSVELIAQKDGVDVWHQSYLLDACGNKEGQAMARLVSLPVSLAVDAILSQSTMVGVSAAPDQSTQIEAWLKELTTLGEEVFHKDHLNL
jgi:saccharopine dehydrogenase (NADP+, L-glutamate forming)